MKLSLRMTSEAGTQECYALLKAKVNIEEAIQVIAKLKHAEHIKQQLLAVHNQLEGMHELKRRAVQSNAESSI